MTKAKAITNNITENMDTQKNLFRFLIFGLMLLLIFYIYLVSSITFNVIARKSLESKVGALTSHINELEITYLNNLNKINKEYVKSEGYVDISQNIFVSRDINHVAIR